MLPATMPQTVLTDLERRTIGNLTIPRNVGDLAGELRRDPYTAFGGRPSDEMGGEQELLAFLDQLVEEGYVVRLGEQRDLSKLASLIADGGKGVVATGDEKARNYLDRLSAPSRTWRQDGDLYMLSQEGLAAIKVPVGPSGLATREDVVRMLTEHARAIKDLGHQGSIFDEDGGTLPEEAAGESLSAGVMLPDGTRVATLLPEEYEAWASKVREHWEAETGEKLPPLMMGGMPGYGNATEDLIQDADKGTGTYTETAPTFMALSLVAVTDTDTGTTLDDGTHLPTYVGYARKSCAATDFGASSAGTRSNANAIVWAGASSGSSTILGAARCTAATLGRVIRYQTVASVTISATQTPAQYAAAALTDTLD